VSRSASRLRRFGAALAVVVLCSFAPAAPPATAPLVFAQSGLAGGGFVNVLAADPFDRSVVLAGGDVSGFHRSTDGGVTWATSNTGLGALTQLPVASILFSATTPGLVYAGVGKVASGGGLLVSHDDGQSWSMLSTTPQFSGTDNPLRGLPHMHPRSTGVLLAEDPAGAHLYAATFDQGVLRSDDGGHTWMALGLSGSFLRGLALDPADPDTVYAAAYNDGVYVTTNASTTGAFTQLAGSPATPEELAVIGGSLYVAGGKAGVFRTRDGGSTWQQLGGTAIPTNGPTWMSIAGYRACGRDVVFAGATGGGANAIVRSTDDGATWASVTADPTRIHTTIGGPGGPEWWLRQATFLPGGDGYVVSSIVTGTGTPGGGDCLDPDVEVAGRSGIWGSANAGDDWYPMMQGLGVSVARDVAGDPSIAGRTYVAAADWAFLYSTNSLASVTQKKPTGVSRGADLWVDAATSPARVFIGASKPTTNGEVFSSLDPATKSWVDEGLSSVVSGGWAPLAVAEQRFGTQRILLAAVERTGIWRKVGTTWAKVNGVAMTQPQISRGASFAWAPGSDAVFLFDRETGVWRSGDRGRTWTKIWSLESSVPGTGYLAIDPAAPTRLFVSAAGSGVWRIDGATSGSVDGGTLTPVLVGDFPTAGPMEPGPGGLIWLATAAAPGVAPALYSTDDGGATWSLRSDRFYEAAALFPFDLYAAPDGRVFVATNGDGVVVGTSS
jgi:hypothetical protein